MQLVVSSAEVRKCLGNALGNSLHKPRVFPAITLKVGKRAADVERLPCSSTNLIPQIPIPELAGCSMNPIGADRESSSNLASGFRKSKYSHVVAAAP
jgi:hypothetical protein